MIDKIAAQIESGLNVAGEAISDLPESAGNYIQNVLRSLAVSAVSIPGRLLSWSGSIISDIASIPGISIKGVLNIAGGSLSGLTSIIAGLLTLNMKQIEQGCYNFFANLSGAMIVVAGSALSMIQNLFAIQQPGRPLTEIEHVLLKTVFGNSISYYNIQIVQGHAGLFRLGGSVFALGNKIFMQNVNPQQHPHILIHECVHIWQFQNKGCRYAADALIAQFTQGRKSKPGNAYDWKAEIIRGMKQWEDLNYEAQAQLVEDLWSQKIKYSTAGKEKASDDDLPDTYFDFGTSTLKSLQSASNFRLSGYFDNKQNFS